MQETQERLLGMGTQSVRLVHERNVSIKQAEVTVGHCDVCQVILNDSSQISAPEYL